LQNVFAENFLEVTGLAETVADEVRTKEAGAREIIAAAKTEGARMIVAARTAGEQAVKEARQKSHRYFRDKVREAEAEAEETAAKIVGEGRVFTDKFYGDTKPRVAEVAEWLVKEVVSAYGD
jgi:V/A-type H+-transporting ATPase subunit G/H